MATPARTVREADPLYEFERMGLHARREYRIKGSLPALARQVLSDFPRALRDLPKELDSPGASDLIAQYNLGSLAQIQYGCVAKGLALCQKEIEICLQLTDESGTLRWTRELFQPWINIGRIAAARGDTERGLDIFRQVFRFVTEHEDFEIGGKRLDSSALAPPPGQIGRIAPLFEVYLQDSVKALACAGNYVRIITFLDETEHLPGFDTPHFQRLIAESRARALLEQGRTREAAQVMEKLLSWLGSDALPQPAVCFFLAEILLQGGDPEGAHSVMRDVERHYPDLCAGDVPLSERRKFRYLEGFQYYRLGHIESATDKIAQALRMNEELGDEPGIIKCRILLLRCARLHDEDTMPHSEALRAAAEGSLYRHEQALAFYELAECGVSREAATLLDLCERILQPIDTQNSRLLRRDVAHARENLLVAFAERPAIPMCPEMDEMYELLLQADPRRYLRSP
jgi:tetratricopeptide (TPR) repeat protein